VTRPAAIAVVGAALLLAGGCRSVQSDLVDLQAERRCTEAVALKRQCKRVLRTEACPEHGPVPGKLDPELYEDRYEAAVSLAKEVLDGTPSYVARRDDIAKGLRGRLDDRSALVRQVAIDGLVAVEGAGAAAAIADRLRDRDVWVRYTAVKALGRIQARDRAEGIAHALRRDEGRDVRRAAAQALREARATEAARELFLALAGDDSPDRSGVRYHAYLALRALTGKDPGESPRAWRPIVGQ